MFRHFNDELDVLMRDLDFSDGKQPVRAPASAPVSSLLPAHSISNVVAIAAVVML
jgi:hypothetical protein